MCSSDLLFLAGDLVAQDGDLLNAFPMVLCLGAVPTSIGLLVAWATVWRWLASRPKWLYVAAEIVVIIACVLGARRFAG